MKMARASKDDLDRMIAFMQFIEEFMDYGTHTPQNDEYEEESIELTDEGFAERLRELWGRRFGHHGVDIAWSRVVFGCGVLIDNVCDPNADTLEWKPELAAKIEGWRCFHCDQVFGDRDAALVHFGGSEIQTPACKIDAVAFRDLERLAASYVNEDTELHKEVAALRSRLADATRRAEEDGYARGLADAKKHPGELGLCVAEPEQVKGGAS
ncbi:hypothetical protein [Allorhodopirellula heiligendammensis]|uniref:Uncharacterized protein n=1 Tax=Allorhodopirellula heiligendammensis TaxID=2714739 RepID=A0A5C6BU89_9BACT|nr:hypothetical protein [Allorhodopirellula heiligendammensis]TWU15051.1 hypothetical protein Poly21_22420 [Allorhodopirellula heiligendammensis]